MRLAPVSAVRAAAVRLRSTRPGRKAATSLLLGALVATGSVTAVAPASAGASMASYDASMLSLINSARQAKGLRPLRPVFSMTSGARWWAGQMAAVQRMSHDPDLGRTAARYGCTDWSVLAENVGWRTETNARGLFDAYMASPGHRDAILSREYTQVGVGTVERDGTVWNTIKFSVGCPSTAPVTAPKASSASRPTVPASKADRELRLGGLLASRRPGGELWSQSPDRTGVLTAARKVGRGWGSYTALVGPGDWDGDRKADVLARDGAGKLWLYRGNGGDRLSARTQVGSGWKAFSAVESPGDWDGDGRADVLARDSAGRLWLYPGNGRGGWLARTQVGSGWSGFTALVTPGDWDGDRRADVLARDRAGRLWLYPGNGRGGWLRPKQVGAGWHGFTTIVGVGDVTADGGADVYARDAAGRLWLYAGDGAGRWLPRVAATA